MIVKKLNFFKIQENVELLWRFAKAQYQISELKEKAGDVEAQKLMLEKGLIIYMEFIIIVEIKKYNTLIVLNQIKIAAIFH